MWDGLAELVHSPQKPPMFAIKSSMSIGLLSDSFVSENEPRARVRYMKPNAGSPPVLQLESELGPIM